MGKARKHTDQFSQGEDLDLDAIIYLIGVQELGQIHREFKRRKTKFNAHRHLPFIRALWFYEFDFLMRALATL
jgi:hypothetical protein